MTIKCLECNGELLTEGPHWYREDGEIKVKIKIFCKDCKSTYEGKISCQTDSQTKTEKK